MPWGILERSGDDNMSSQCDMCSNYVYDEDEGYYYCDVNLDEDDMYRFMKGSIDNCSFFSLEDEYKLARKQ